MTDLIRPNELRGDAHDWTGRFRGQDVWDVLTAARAGDSNRLRPLLSRVPDIVAAEYWYTPPLHFAVREGHAAATWLLLDAGADISHRTLYGGETLLQVATERGHEEVAAIIRSEMERRFAGDGTTHHIHEAVQAGDLDAVSALLDADAALVNRGDALGRRPLHYAVENVGEGGAGEGLPLPEGAEMLDLLLDRGADIDATGFSSDDRLGGQDSAPSPSPSGSIPTGHSAMTTTLRVGSSIVARNTRPPLPLPSATRNACANSCVAMPALQTNRSPAASAPSPPPPNATTPPSSICCSTPAPIPTFPKGRTAPAAMPFGQHPASATEPSQSVCSRPERTQTQWWSPPARPRPLPWTTTCGR